MCKLLIMTGITEGLVAEEFMRRMAVPMSRYNSHGIGYTAVGEDGELFSQRWLNNDQFFDRSNVMITEIAEALKPYESRLPKGALENNYSELGNVDLARAKTVTMHTRFATCGREFANTHPFIDQDTSLIHNGSITNAFSTTYRVGLDLNKISTCDSEAALQAYLLSKVDSDPTKAKEWLDLLSGSWAFGILARNEQGNRILDVVKGSSNLYYMEIEGIGKVFTTDDDDAKAVVKDMGLNFTKEAFRLVNDEMYRFDTTTGKMLASIDIKPVYKNWGREEKKSGRTTGNTTSNSQSNKSSRTANTNRPGENLIALVGSFRNDPDAMSLMPDIFTDNSDIKNLKIDFRKVKKYCNDTTILFVERLDIFDLVFNGNFVDMYASLPPVLKEYIRETDNRQGCKAARDQITNLYEKRESMA